MYDFNCILPCLCTFRAVQTVRGGIWRTFPSKNRPVPRLSLSPLILHTMLLCFSILTLSFLSCLPFQPLPFPSVLLTFLLSIHPINHTHLTPRPSFLPTPSFLRTHAISNIVMHLNKSIARHLFVKLTFSITLFHIQVQLQLQVHVNWNIIIKINTAKLLSHPSTRTHTHIHTHTIVQRRVIILSN